MHFNLNGHPLDLWAQITDALTDELSDPDSSGIDTVDALELAASTTRLLVTAGNTIGSQQTEIGRLKDQIARLQEGHCVDMLTGTEDMVVDNMLTRSDHNTQMDVALWQAVRRQEEFRKEIAGLPDWMLQRMHGNQPGLLEMLSGTLVYYLQGRRT